MKEENNPTYRYTFKSGADYDVIGVSETHENKTLTIEKEDGTKVPFHPVDSFNKKPIAKI